MKPKTTTKLEISTKTVRALGLHFGLGLIGAVGILVLITLAIQLMLNACNIGTDSTDEDGWNRSGMKLYRDHQTGVEYLSAPDGGIIRREDR